MKARTAMRNRAMARKLASGEAVDVRTMLRNPLPDLVADHEGNSRAVLYTLSEYIDGKDYCDADFERWIWSIGRSLEDGRILASTDTRFYQNPDFECLWLR